MKKTILIVDDSNTIRSSIMYTLSKVGFNVIMAEHGRDAIDKLDNLYKENNSVSMIISDVNMPVMDGISFVREVKKIDNYKYIPILIVTTETEDEKKRQGKEAGASGWLVKPFSPEQLIAVVKKFVR